MKRMLSGVQRAGFAGPGQPSVLVRSVLFFLLTGCLPTNGIGQENLLSQPPNTVTGGVSLILDDGSIEISIGLEDAGQFLWLNRFTPESTDFPLTLDEVQVLFATGSGVIVGELLDIYFYEDTDGDGDPGTGAVFKGSIQDQQVQAVDNVTWSVFPVPFLVFEGPGDILIAVVNRTAGTNPGDRPAALDESTSNSRSWLATYAGNPPDPPTFPAPLTWTIIGGGGNWMIRAFGSQGVVRPGIGFEPDSMFFSVSQGSSDSLTMALSNTGTGTIHFDLSDELSSGGDAPWLSEIPPSGDITPGGTTERSIVVDAAGLTVGDYAASVVITSDDLFHPDTTMPVFLHVGGAPDIEILPDSLVFLLPVLITESDTLSIAVTNLGSVDLHIDTIISSEAAFVPQPAALSLDPLETVEVEIIFSPDSAGHYTGTVSLFSDDPDEPLSDVFVEGDAVTAPSILLDTDSVDVHLEEGDSIDVAITLVNNGGSPLTWSASIVPANRVERKQNRRTALTEGVNDVATENGPLRINLARNQRPFQSGSSLLFDNGPLVNSAGSGVGGADESVLQNLTLGMTTFGFSHQVSTGSRVADDFTVFGNGWQIDSISFFGYQTLSDTIPTIDHLNFRIWDDQPGEAESGVVFGDTLTNRLISSRWSHVYRVSESTSGMNTDRPVMHVSATAGVFLTPGRYWLDWQAGGSLSSGPWAAPVTITGQNETGDGLLYIGSWIDATDVGEQGFPFLLHGNVVGDFVSILPPSSGIVQPGEEATLILRLTGTHADTALAATLVVQSNDPVTPVMEIPVSAVVGTPTGIPSEELPHETMLFQNYPNPFNPTTSITYALEIPRSVTLKIYDILGREVKTLVDERKPAGSYSVIWDATNSAGVRVASGVYVFVLDASQPDGSGGLMFQRRMVLVR